MKTEFKTEIVETKQPIRSYTIVFGILYLLANFYIFLLDKENQNNYLKFTALIIIVLGAYFIVENSLKKPNIIGIFKISKAGVTIYTNSKESKVSLKEITLNEIESIFLKYMGYGSWTSHSIYGNKNYIKIVNKNGDTYNLEVLLRNKKMKNDFKTVLKNLEINEKLTFIRINNSRTEF